MGVEEAVALDWFLGEGAAELGGAAITGEIAATAAASEIGGANFASEYASTALAGEGAAATAGADYLGQGLNAASATAGGFNPALSAAAQTFGTASTFNPASSGLGWADVKSALQIAGPALSIGSGLYGMSAADTLRKQALLSQNKSTPWQASGGMGLADQQLQQLMQNPGQVAAQDPSYALRMQGAQRATAQYGQDSGAMSVAGANASTDWYNQRLQALGGLAGANVNPALGQQVGLQGTEAANKLMSSGLGSIGYGVTSLGGNSMGFTPQQIAALQAAGIKLPPGML